MPKPRGKSAALLRIDAGHALWVVINLGRKICPTQRTALRSIVLLATVFPTT